MPILRRTDNVLPAEESIEALLKQNGEVFYDADSGAIFSDYEKYLEHFALQSKPIWTCRYTGRTGLTYQAALASERESEMILESFPDCWKPFIFALVQYSSTFLFSFVFNCLRL